MTEKTYCCEMLRLQIEKTCHEHGSECPDILIGKFKDGNFHIPIHDGGNSGIEIHYCPWCGTKLPPVRQGTPMKIVRLRDMLDGWIDDNDLVQRRDACIDKVRYALSMCLLELSKGNTFNRKELQAISEKIADALCVQR